MPRLHRGYLIVTIVLAALAFVVTLILTPEWAGSWRTLISLAVAAVVGAVGFMAALRQAVQIPSPPPEPKPAQPAISQSQRSGLQVGGSTVRGDVVDGDKFSGDKIVNVLPPVTLFSTLHQLPRPPADFTGREAELKELRERIKQGGAIISGLHGQGGVGKTVLALKLAEELKGQYPDAQFYVDLQGVSDRPLSPADALSRVIRAYHPEAKLPESVDELRGIYLSLLYEKKALLLMDNAKDRAQVAPLIPPGTCLLLITSRQHFTLENMHPQTVGTLPEAEARELLIKIAPRLAPTPVAAPSTSTSTSLALRSVSAQDAATEIARLCGYLPLALRAAGSLLKVTLDLSPADYATQLRDERTRLERLGAEGVEVSVEASLNLSYARLPSETARVFRQSAVFPASFEASAEEAACQDPEHKHLSELVKRSLVRYHPPSPVPRAVGGTGEGIGGGAGRYSLHDLARLFAQKQLNDVERYEAQKRHATHYEAVLRAADELYLKGGDSILRGLALFDLEWVNIQAGQAWAAGVGQIGNLSNEAAQLCNDYPHAGAYCFKLRLRPRDWIRWLEAALAAARRLKAREDEGIHLGNLGLGYADLDEPRKAIEFYEQALAIARAIGDRGNEGIWLGNLGNAYAVLGEPRKAIEFGEQALAIARVIGNRRGEEINLGILGNAYADLGERRKAIEFYEQALVIIREIGDRPTEGIILVYLGEVYIHLGEPRKAIEFGEQALVIDREIGDRRGEGASLGNLGSAYYSLGEPRKAIEFYEQQLTIVRAIGNRHGEGGALEGLGIGHDALGEPRKAIEFFEQSLAIKREIGDRRGEGNTFFNISLALDKLGEREKAIPLAEAALKIFEQIEDPNAERVRKKLAGWRNH